MADDPYAVLGVDPGADLAELRRAYLRQLRLHHPDVRPGDAAAEQRTRELNRAWDQVKRRTHRPRPAPSTARPRPPAHGYSHERHAFRVAFTSATLRVALALLALGLLILAAVVR